MKQLYVSRLSGFCNTRRMCGPVCTIGLCPTVNVLSPSTVRSATGHTTIEHMSILLVLTDHEDVGVSETSYSQ